MPRPGIELEDVEFLALHGETWDAVEVRVGFGRKSIDKALRRTGRLDLIAVMHANSAHEVAS